MGHIDREVRRVGAALAVEGEREFDQLDAEGLDLTGQVAGVGRLRLKTAC